MASGRFGVTDAKDKIDEKATISANGHSPVLQRANHGLVP
jgi:hypothetical protein